MTHLYIEQNTGLTEEVNSSIISKLYELAISGDLDNTSDLKGRLHSALGYQNEIDYLNNKYSELYISADQMYIKFEDPIVERICATTWGDGTGITIAQAASVTNIGTAFQGNTQITKFNEFKYFTGLTYTGWVDNNVTLFFKDCTSLTEITIPKGLLTMRGSGFSGCTSLQNVYFDQPSSFEHIPSFTNCVSLHSPIILPNSVRYIPSDYIRDNTSNGNQGTLSNIHTIVTGNQMLQIDTGSGGNGHTHPLDFIIYTTTPPTLGMSGWNWANGRITFYVPDSAVNDYKTTGYWTKVADYIKPISEYAGTEWDTSLAASMYGYNPS